MATLAADKEVVQTSELFPVTDAIIAFATGGQTNAVQLAVGSNRIATCATIGDSVKLPIAIAGMVVDVFNAGAAAGDVFPGVGDAINSLAANTAFRLLNGYGARFTCTAALQWNMCPVPLPPAKFVLNATSGATVAAAGDMTGADYVSLGLSGVGAANYTTRTATQMFNDMGNVQPGDSYTLEITNTSGGTTTLVAGSGVTLTGTMTMATNTTRRFNVKFTTATALVIQSVGVGTIS